jgi:DNA topoisomerase-1
MEENGIGRPPRMEILRKIEDREYVRKKDSVYPTALGRSWSPLIPYFDDFFETGYTARLEEELDEVEEGQVDEGARRLRQEVHARP